MHLKPLIFFASGIAISWGQTVADVLNDITGIKTQATALNDAIDAFPASGGNLIQALVNNLRFFDYLKSWVWSRWL